MFPHIAVSLALLTGGPPAGLPQSHALRTQSTKGFDCSVVSCKRLRSCEEACYKLLVCGQRKRDGDHDGIPCENLCSAPCK